MKKIIITFFLALFSFVSLAQKPYDLMTDLITRTDVVYVGGYQSSLTLTDVSESGCMVQYAAIASEHPRFSWAMSSDCRDVTQTAYQIVLDRYNQSWEQLWDSGIVRSARSSGVQYDGDALEASTLYRWRVKTWNDKGEESEFSSDKLFRTASSLGDSAVSIEPIMKTDQLPSRVERLEDGTWFIDYGKDAFGQLRVNLTADKPDMKVTLHLGERIRNGRLDRTPPGTCRYRRIELPLMQGTHTYQIAILPDYRNTHGDAVLMPEHIGEVLPFRYVEIEGYGRALEDSDVIRAYVHHPSDKTSSSFICSSEKINQLWELCKYSMEATSFTGYHIDGDRERIPYECDALINQLAFYGADHVYSLSRRTTDYLLEHPTWPTEWILQTVLMAWYDYLYTGDTRLLEARYEMLSKHTLSSLRGECGLISTRADDDKSYLAGINRKEDIKDIVDWPQGHGSFGLPNSHPGETDYFQFMQYNAVVNAYHIETLSCMARIASATGREDEALKWTDALKTAIRQYNGILFNPVTKLYVDGFDVKDGMISASEHSALHSNMFPLAFGLVPDKFSENVASYVKSRGMACSIANSKFLMDALYETDFSDYALELLESEEKRSWYNTILAGSTMTMEAWDDSFKPNQDWNHAWGACLADIIPHRLLGIRPLAPGFETVEVKPQISKLDFAQCTVPTVKGPVCVRMDASSLELSLPANMKAVVYVPIPADVRKPVLQIDGNTVKASKDKSGKFFIVSGVGSGNRRFCVKEKM